MELRNARRYHGIRQNGRPTRQTLARLLVPRRRFDSTQPELIDRPDLDRDSLRQELSALEDANRRLGGHHLVLHYLQRLLGSRSSGSLTVLDLGTGVADIPRALVAFARARKLHISVTAVDGSPRVLEFAQAACRDWPEISLQHHNLLTLPHRPDTFDVVICSLALHHFDRADAVKILGRVHEIARLGYIINDLRRNWFSILATPLLAGAVMRDEIVRQDAVASCRAAFSVAELRSMADEAGLENYKINRHHLGFRMVLHGTK